MFLTNHKPFEHHSAKKIPELPKGSRILLFNYDNGSNYFSIEGLF